MTIYWGDGTSTSTNPSGGAAESSGTWSPSYYNANNVSISTNAAQYIAVGDLVHFNIRFYFGFTYDSDHIRFTLPYTNGGDEVIVIAIKQGAGGDLMGKIPSGDSWCQIRGHNNDDHLTYSAHDGYTYVCSGTYQK